MYCVKVIEGMGLIIETELTESTRRILYVQCFQISLHNDDNKFV